jgi:hypothetical protein
MIKKLCWSDQESSQNYSSCTNSCAPNQIFCYNHCNQYNIKTVYPKVWHKIKKIFCTQESLDENTCQYNSQDYNCGICFESHHKKNILLFLTCCNNKQVTCIDCITNIMIQYHNSMYRQSLSDSDYLFFLISRSSFPCPFCRKHTTLYNIDRTHLISYIRKNVLQKIKPIII